MDALNHKLTALDKKINAMTRLEFKVEQVSERVEEVGILSFSYSFSFVLSVCMSVFHFFILGVIAFCIEQ